MILQAGTTRMPSNLPTGPFEKLGILFKMTLSHVFFREKNGASTGIVLVFLGGRKCEHLSERSLPRLSEIWGGGWWNMRILHPRWSLNLISNRLLPPKNSLRIDTSQKESPFWSFWEIHGNWFQPLVFGGCKTIRSVKQKTLPLYWHVIPTPPLHIYTPED